jgi:hypothetical protein
MNLDFKDSGISRATVSYGLPFQEALFLQAQDRFSLPSHVHKPGIPTEPSSKILLDIIVILHSYEAV